MSDIVNYVSSALARGIHQNAFAASCDGTQMLAGPDRFPRLRKDLKKEPDPTATLPAPEGGELAGPRGAAIVTAPWGGVKCSDMFTAGQGGGAGGPQPHVKINSVYTSQKKKAVLGSTAVYDGEYEGVNPIYLVYQ